VEIEVAQMMGDKSPLLSARDMNLERRNVFLDIFKKLFRSRVAPKTGKREESEIDRSRGEDNLEKRYICFAGFVSKHIQR
jgi:hypothetical protein